MREFELQDCISKSRMALRNRLQKRTFSDTVVTDGCTKVLKFVEGLHNKALLLTMNNGKEVFAKLPNPNAGPARYVTASEVATREFLSHPGSQFASTGTLSGLFQARTFGVVAEKIWDWIEDLRDDLTITPELWEKNEMAWVKGHASPRMNYYVSLKDPELPDQALTLLSKYLEPTPYLVPSEPEAAANVLWHPDLHLDNIFVDPTTSLWDTLRPAETTKCPIDFTRVELALHAKEDEKIAGIGTMLKLFQDQGVLPVDGMVDQEDYEAAKINCQKFKDIFVALAKDEEERELFSKLWPYQDQESK
ncbi:hypothetical protein CPC735_060150 [Coccidioides posadasii C735 delta SOWgp]|uniref:Altered inheritance of mitochondria protein 9, mitochondrial n=1 Tax=Coccidioides posadasii (strain C735) TaxID=222929 RepID=C5PF65_COCP7|nr:hypothetical protein CPC735_060150 [Coccidioides posadasii C735 delta SOWgp]EER24645.1 hypothetical protein CPC735_060150 [Coccidioides posadasii C735 delta SOWgp]|eukprot:XP_003066790.1 hypothetical protein CPC735_060150 [Coccidioides posadasii C735 delta SOWgp]